MFVLRRLVTRTVFLWKASSRTSATTKTRNTPNFNWILFLNVLSHIGAYTRTTRSRGLDIDLTKISFSENSETCLSKFTPCKWEFLGILFDLLLWILKTSEIAAFQEVVYITGLVILQNGCYSARIRFLHCTVSLSLWNSWAFLSSIKFASFVCELWSLLRLGENMKN